MSILDESSEPAAKKKKGVNSEENTMWREDGEDLIKKMQRTHDILWEEREE